MAVEVLMPALSPTMTEGKLAKWSKSVGDAVKPGDILAEIETDKATMEVEAVEEGVLDQILVPAGTEGVAVNTPIAIVRGEGDITFRELLRALDGSLPLTTIQGLWFRTPSGMHRNPPRPPAAIERGDVFRTPANKFLSAGIGKYFRLYAE